MVCHCHFAETLVRAPEKPEIRPDLGEPGGSAECHRRVHAEPQRLSPAAGVPAVSDTAYPK